MTTYSPARYIDLHALHPMPASVLNRGEDNEPKTLLLGGAVRAMVSSHALKRPIRLALEQELDEHAARTRMLPLRVADALRATGWPEDLAAFADAQVVRSANREGLKTEDTQNGITSAMLYLPRDVLDDLTALCLKYRADLEEAHAEAVADAARPKTKGARKSKPAAVLPTGDVAALIKRRTATINLFGRMLAEIPGAQVDGAAQIAPAFSVHQSGLQPDFFTAVEDWGGEGDSSGAHLQTAFFTTGTLYRYATVNLTELIRNLDGDQAQAHNLLALFTEAFMMTLPPAKKTSTAPTPCRTWCTTPYATGDPSPTQPPSNNPSKQPPQAATPPPPYRRCPNTQVPSTGCSAPAAASPTATPPPRTPPSTTSAPGTTPSTN